MKIRLIWCIHIVAFLFSVLVLSISAFSYYRAVSLFWNSDGTNNEIHFAEGYAVVERRFEPRMNVPFGYTVTDRLILYPMMKTSRLDSRCSFLSVRHLTKFNNNGIWENSFTAVALRSFLFFPMAWLCGFYLVRWRRQIRARRAEQQTQGKDAR